MFHPKVFHILELCFRKTFYHKITTYTTTTGFLTKLAVILCTFYFWLSTSVFWRNGSFKSALRSWFQKLNYLKTSPLRDRKSCYLFFYSKLTNSLILEYSFRVISWKPWNYSQNNKMRLSWNFFSKIPKMDYFRTK